MMTTAAVVECVIDAGSVLQVKDNTHTDCQLSQTSEPQKRTNSLIYSRFIRL